MKNTISRQENIFKNKTNIHLKMSTTNNINSTHSTNTNFTINN